MNIRREELIALIGLLSITELEEINCEEFLARTPGFLEGLRVQKPVDAEKHQSYLHHLKLCPECQEEFDGLCEALSEGVL